jgi:hypothetical protein
MKDVIQGRVYDTDTAELLADDHYWDGSNWERRGRNRFLYRTARGAYFVHTTTQWQGEVGGLMPVSREEAMALWDELREKRGEGDMAACWERAFGEKPEEA